TLHVYLFPYTTLFRSNRMKKKLFSIIAAVALLLASFTAGVYAAKTDWLWFTGDVLIEQSDEHVEEIMTILRQVNADKITAEEARSEEHTSELQSRFEL